MKPEHRALRYNKSMPMFTGHDLEELAATAAQLAREHSKNHPDSIADMAVTRFLRKRWSAKRTL